MLLCRAEPSTFDFSPVRINLPGSSLPELIYSVLKPLTIQNSSVNLELL